jgi:outer membrane protein OmpA-like peptidoglycan-associated protein
MFPQNRSGIGVRRLGLAIGLATLLVTGPGAFAQSATDIIRELAPIDESHAPPPPPARSRPEGGYSRYSGPRVEDTEVYIDGRRSRVYIDYSRAIDLIVYFEYNSANVTDRAREVLDRLGEALASPELRHHRFLVAGHTDAVGTDEVNLDLSYRRAWAVYNYLWQVHGIQRYRIAVKGWGRSRLKDPANPESGINRRVEVALIVDHGTSYLEDEQGYANTRYRGPAYTSSPLPPDRSDSTRPLY